jgi:hypothetical protein
VSPDAIAAGAAKQIAQLEKLGCECVVLMTDRESRPEAASTFGERIGRAVADAASAVAFHVVIADRMIENWFLADVEELSAKRAFVKRGLRQKNYEGTHGKAVLKGLLVKNHAYSEVRDGPALFETIRLSVAVKNSASLARLVAVIDASGGAPMQSKRRARV